jgi:hypothetical protein
VDESTKHRGGVDAEDGAVDSSSRSGKQHAGASDTGLELPSPSPDSKEKKATEERCNWKRIRGAVATATATTITTAEHQQEEGGATIERRLQERIEDDAYVAQPGAYRMYVGRDLRRATSGDPSEDTELSGDDQLRQQPAAARTVDDIYMAEANLVVEDDPVEATPLRLVEAAPIRHRRQIAFVIAALVVVATGVGVAVGLTRRPTPPPPPPRNLFSYACSHSGTNKSIRGVLSVNTASLHERKHPRHKLSSASRF